tara:strand:+ start:1633 stop:2832 length:1200 start_codon:yes stop_codon:yes gene_type:complete
MFIKDFNQNGQQRIQNLQKLLNEEFSISFAQTFPEKDKLIKLRNSAETRIIQLKGSSKQFQLEPEYVKYLGIRDISETMLAEGYYAESPKYTEMKDMLNASIEGLMDSGYTMDEACGECMNRYRMDNRFAFDDEHVLPIIIKAAKQYMESFSSNDEAIQETQTDLNDRLLSELAKEIGVELKDTTSYDAIEEKLNMFAEVSGKSRDAVVGFLNSLEEDAVEGGIQMFGKKIAEQNRDNTEEEELDEGMFDDIIDEMISEEIEGTSVDEAEVVMAVRALADDLQDQVERLGRMKNEDIPAISDSMVSEFGLESAQGFKGQAEQILDDALLNAKSSKEGMDGLIGNITGVGALGSSDLEEPDLGIGDMGMEEPLPEPEIDINEPAAAGPEEEPLGRAPVEV